MTRPLELLLITSALAAMVMAPLGCGDDAGWETDGSTSSSISETSENDTSESTQTNPDSTSNPDERNEEESDLLVESDSWRVLYSYRGRLPDNTDENDLWIMEPDGEEALSITDLGGLKNLENLEGAPLSCNYGCVVSSDLVWIAIVTGLPTSEGRSFMIGKFNDQLEVSMFKGAVWNDIIDFKFADNKLFYTKRVQCVGQSCQYDLYRVELPNINDKVKVLTYPQEAELEQSTFTGRFKVSPNGKKVVLLNTTIRSVTVNMWQEGIGLFELDYICKFGTKGNCSGTGSEYSDIDPVAISPDGRWVVFFTFSDRWQRARLYDSENPGDLYLSTIASVPGGAYIEHACDPGILDEWQWERVTGAPLFTPDGETVLFQTETDCPIEDDTACPQGESCLPQKPRTNIRSIKLDTLLDGATLTESDVFNVTQHPYGDVTANRRITSIALSPDGATIIFSASPMLDQNGKLLTDGTARQRNDREVYRIRIDGVNGSQLTNNLSWMAESVRVTLPAPKKLLDVLNDDPDFSTLLSALDAADLGAGLADEGPFTLFAPTNAAFEALGSSALDDLLAPENKEVLANLLEYHIYLGFEELMSSNFIAADGNSIAMLNGELAAIDGVNLSIAGAPLNESKLDIVTANGVIHGTDALMTLPAEDDN